MDLAQLQLVKHILMTGSLRKTAARFKRAQSVVSRQLATLEKECGGRLFYRNGRGVALTELGERILPQIDLIIGAAHEIAASSEALKNDVSGDVRLHITPLVAHGLMEPLYKSLRERHPGIRLHVAEATSNEIERDLEEGRTDLAIYLRNASTAAAGDRFVCETQTYLVGPPTGEFKRRDVIRFENIAKLPLILPTCTGPCRNMLNEVAAARGVTLNVAAEANGAGAMRLLLLSGAGYLVTPLCRAPGPPMCWVEAEIARGALTAMRIIDPPFSRALVMRKASSSRRRVDVVANRIDVVLRTLIGAAPRDANHPAEMATEPRAKSPRKIPAARSLP